MAKDSNSASVYERVLGRVFSGETTPGSKVVEQDLANQLGVSRIPIRESLGKMVGQGLLVGEQGGRGVRLRSYTTDDIRQLYELREMLEGGAARGAARAATATDVQRLRLILQQLEAEVGNYGSRRWADLDHAFHAAMADASHNERIARALKLLLTECHYVMFLYPPRGGRPAPSGSKPSQQAAVKHMRLVFDEHVSVLERICAGDIDGAEQMARQHMRASILRLTESIVARDLAG